jgi:hypothetical protein
MKKVIARALVVAAVVGLASFALAADPSQGSWTGIITDTGCGAKGATAEHASCAAKCVKEHGAKYALYTPSDKQVWVLSNQDEAAKMAGKEVTVTGKADKAKMSIEVASMEPTASK